MGERAEEPDKAEQSASGPDSKPEAGGGSTEHNLPVVWSPKLGADAGSEEEFIHAEVSEAPPPDEAIYEEPAKEDASEAAAPATSRSWRFAQLAATVALAAALGSFIGSLSGAGVGRLMPETPPSATNVADVSGVMKALKAQLTELNTMKSSLDGAVRNSNTQLTAIAERLDRVERAATNPSAQLAHIADVVDRLNKINSAPETTASIGSAAAAAPPAEPKLTDRIVEDWIVQEVHGDRALVEARNGSLFEVGAGSILPGIGKVEAVKRQDGQWVVVTARGLIVSGR